ncbi:MAG TPA: tetratricopeptide repeat protein [Nannocystaceae bacterium]|nr:tetratricopeptide repeat protein [Nannocystaceae bacterium]
MRVHASDGDGSAPSAIDSSERSAPLEDDSLLRAVADAPSLRLALEVGAVIDATYRIEGELGRGAMGVVYVATDLALDRRVALKVHSDSAEDVQTSRMWREAKAMARLSDPNVVTVHEVGVHDDRVYIAMELVEGGTLAEWMATPHDWREVVAVFVQAARGLAAAHHVGLVHRDFKPSNVLVDTGAGRRGPPRVRVADFGLARAAIDREGSTESSVVHGTPGSSMLDEKLTATGAAVGTPAYMSPEQLEGRVDHRSDQYSFFVALHEALYGARPSADRSLAETSGTVPPWLRTIVLRGLQHRPEDRFGDMDAVVRALESDPTRRRRIVVASALGGGVVIGLLGTIVNLAARSDAVDCRARSSVLATQWNDDVRSSVRDAMLATAVPFAPDTWAHVEPALDAWVSEWTSAATSACEGDPAIATEALRKAQALCLEHERQSFGALLEVLAAANAKTVERAITAVAALPVAARCSDVAVLAADVAPPDDPEIAASVELVRTRLSRAAALDRGGAFADGMAIAAPALVDAVALGWAPLVAESAFSVGSLAHSLGRYDDAERQLREAYREAVGSGADEVAANAAVRLVQVVGAKLARHDEGLQWGFHADAEAHRVGDDPRRGAQLLDNLGEVHRLRGDLDRALDHHQRALGLREGAQGREHVDVARTLNLLGTVQRERADYDASIAALERGLAIRRAELAPEHPLVASTLSEIAATHFAMGDRDGAIDYARASLAIRERVYGPDHPELAGTLSNLGAFLVRRGDLEEALALQERALAIDLRTGGEQHPNVAISLENIGNIHFARGELDLAESSYRRALAIREASLGADHLHVAMTLENIALVLLERDRYDDARALDLRALQIAEQSVGPDHPQVADALAYLGNIETEAGRPQSALDYHERALAIRRAAFGDGNIEIVDSEQNIANALQALARPREALAHLETARAILQRTVGADDPRNALVSYNLGQVHLALGDAEAAVRELEASLAMRERNDTAPADLADTRSELARAIVAAGGDRERAIALAIAARDGYGTTPGELKLRAAIEAWLATTTRRPAAAPRPSHK